MFVRKQTVDGIMGEFHKTIDKLETLSSNANIDVETLEAQRVAIDEQIKTAQSEGSRATQIAGSLRKLISSE